MAVKMECVCVCVCINLINLMFSRLLPVYSYIMDNAHFGDIKQEMKENQ